MRWSFPILLATMGALAWLSASSSLPTEIFIFAIAALGFNVLYGMTGLLSFGQSVFFGGAAYCCGLLGMAYPLGAPMLTLAGGLTGLLVALFFSLISLRSRGIYFVMLTLALGQVGYFLALTFKEYTGGENGLSGLARPDVTVFGRVLFELQSPASFMGYCAAVLILAFLFVEMLSRSPLGSVLTALRLNEARTEVLGYRTRWFRLAAFSISGFMTGVAGALYAMFLRFVPLNTIDFETAEKLVIMTIIGGVGSSLGPVVGAALFLLAADLLSPIWPRWLMIMGVLLVLVVMVFKGGVVDLALARIRQRRGAARDGALRAAGEDVA